MKITVEVAITAYRADGTQVQVTNGARKQVGDNPRFAGDEASEVVDAAAKAALSGFRAAFTGPVESVQPGRSVEEWREAAGVPLDGVARIVALLDQFGAPAYTSVSEAKELVRANGADPLANAAEWRAAVNQRNTRSKTADLGSATEDAQIMSLIYTLDSLGAPDNLGPAESGDWILEREPSNHLPSHRLIRRASEIRNERAEGS